MHGRRHSGRIIGERPQHAILEVIHHCLASDIVLFRRVRDMDEIAAHGTARLVAAFTQFSR